MDRTFALSLVDNGVNVLILVLATRLIKGEVVAPGDSIYQGSEMQCLLMVRWIVRSIPHGELTELFLSFQPLLHDWYNKKSYY